MPPFFKLNDLPVASDSERKILDLTFRSGGTTQPAIAEATGLAQQSVSRLVRGLLDRGALRQGPRVAIGRRGQPSMPVEIAPDFAYTIGVAMMTDALSVVLMDFAGAVLEEAQCEMSAMTRSAVLDRLESVVAALMAKRGIDRRRVVGIGVGISGYNLGGRSRYNTPRALDDWALIEIDNLIGDRIGLPVWVENDGNAAAIGESLVGVGRSYSNFVYLYIAAGIGGGIIIDRQLMRGCHGNGGEIGLILPTTIYTHPNMEFLRQLVVRSGIDIGGISEMLAKFDPEWPAIDEWIIRTRDSFSLIASAVSAILDPEAIVLGGRIPASLARKVIPHIEVYDHHRRAQPRPLPRLLAAEASGDACAIGAAMLPLKKYFFSSGR